MTTAWLRQFIGQWALADRATQCGNYDAVADPQSASYDPIASRETNALLWQCVDPATHLPRVPRYTFRAITSTATMSPGAASAETSTGVDAG